MNLNRLRKIALQFDPEDVTMLQTAVDYCGGEDFSGILLSTLDAAKDFRAQRVKRLIKGLADIEVVWLCENARAVRRGD